MEVSGDAICPGAPFKTRVLDEIPEGSTCPECGKPSKMLNLFCSLRCDIRSFAKKFYSSDGPKKHLF